ncbi:MAG: helix-turn-helix domain-containing protein [candidate division Zixibacteria bacterium]|nr:helix-turn-helix domain-containing protein [candidate division Zixibacteria bacterium]
MTNDRQIQEVMVLSEEQQVKAYVHPTRIVIVQMLAELKMTVSQVARKLGVHPANLTHHFKLLQKAGLIRLVEKRDIGKNIEKYYRASAIDFVVNTTRRKQVDKVHLALSVLKADLIEAMGRIKKQDSADVLSILNSARLSQADFNLFVRRLRGLANEFKQCDSDTGRTYNLNVSIYPGEISKTSSKNISIL